MKTLLIDTTFDEMIVAYFDCDKEVVKEISLDKVNHQKKLLSTIDEIIKEIKIDINQLECVCVVVGPGSFTGIRIGISTGLGLTFGTKMKRVEINAFEVIGHQFTGKVEIEAGRGNRYLADINDGEVINIDFIEGIKSKTKYKERGDVVYSENLLKVAKAKIAKKEFCSNFIPLYVRKSQAEINYGKH